jgi:RHS repeat-associated protein
MPGIPHASGPEQVSNPVPNPTRNVLAKRPASRTIGATMQPVPSTPFAPPYVPALGLRSEKPHQGVWGKNPAPYRGHNRCNLRSVLGLRAGCAGNRVRSRCSGEQYDPDLGLYYLRARYYNPATGRFLSRDPEDGVVTDPATLHKYFYAGGDPVNGSDPTGRYTAVLKPVWGGALGEYTGLISAISLTVRVAVVAVAETCALDYAASQLGYTPAFAFCARKRQCSCDAKCTSHVIGMPNHGNTGIYFFGSGTASTCPAAQVNARRNAEETMPFGSHAQHCSFQCTE